MDFKSYLFHGNKMLGHRLVFADREGINFSDNTDGLPFITTMYGQQYFSPGDYLVVNPEGENLRIYKSNEWEPYAKEDADVVQQTGPRSDDGGHTDGDLHGEGKRGDGDGGVRLPHAKAKVVGDREVGRRRRAAQRGFGDIERDAGGTISESQKPRKDHNLDRIRASRRRDGKIS